MFNIISYSEVGRALRLFKDIEKVSLLERGVSRVLITKALRWP